MSAPVTDLRPTRLGGLPLQKVADMAPRFNTLIYGNPGVGKTLLTASADAIPHMRKVLILDVDGGSLAAKGSYPNVERLSITKWEQLQAVYNDLFNDAGHGFQTVAIDTGTEAQKINMVPIMEKAVAKAAADGQTRDPEVPAVREWGISSEQFRRMIRAYRDLPMNFIMTCHVKDDKDEKTGITTKCPDLPGKLARQVAGFFDIVLYMYVREVQKDKADPQSEKVQLRLLSSAASERITAKDRTDKLPPIFQQCNMKYIINTITANKEPVSV